MADEFLTFYEIAERLSISLSAYIGATLPLADRRAPGTADRRLRPRGGRRPWDRHLSQSPVDEQRGSMSVASTPEL